MSLLKTLLHPDHEEKSERAEVAQAANILQIGEFQFLQLAYSQWFDEDMSEESINNLFMSYMYHDRVPHWARHYARQILTLEKNGDLDWLNPHYHRYDRDFHTHVPGGAMKFSIAVTIVIAFIGGMLLIGHFMSGGKSASVLPPYFTQQEISPENTQLAPGRYQ